MRKFLIATGAAVVALFALSMPVGAQTGPTAQQCADNPGYPGCPAPEVVFQFLGTFREGDTFTAVSCGFADGVALEFNTNDAGTDTLGADGCARQTVRIVEDGVALSAPVFAAAGLQLAAPTPQVSVDGKIFEAKQGRNDLTNFGISASPLNPTREVHNLFDIAGPSGGGAVGGSGLPRTGAMILRWSLVALALVAVGTLLVLADRRRKAPIRNTPEQTI